MTISTPQLIIRQRYEASPAAVVENLRLLVVGGNAKLHRYSDTDERPGIFLGEYDHVADTPYTWPGKAPGSVVDLPSAKVFVRKGLFRYFTDLISETGGGKGTVAPVAGTSNRVRSSATSFVTNGSYPRSSLLGDRDVRVGDRVKLRGVFDPEGECEEVSLDTYVAALIADNADGSVGDAVADTNNAQSSASATTTVVATKIGGADNCVLMAANGAAYNGLADGDVTEVYTIEVVRSSLSGCAAARLRVTSASGRDDADDVEVTLGVAVDIGSRGLTATFSLDTGDCEDAAAADEVAANELVPGQKWRIVVTQDFEAAGITAAGEYIGAIDDQYVIEVTKGGLWADLPEITVTTVRGLDHSGPHVVSGDYTDVTIGTYGVTVQFTDAYGDNASQASYDSAASGGDEALSGLRLGDRFYVTVTAPANAQVRTLVLRHDMPTRMRSCTDLDLELFIEAELEITAPRLASPPDVNWEVDTDATQIVMKAGVTSYVDDWTFSGVPRALPLHGGSLYLEYREWLTDATTGVNFVSAADIDTIPGQLSSQNPLKYAVHFGHLNGADEVGYIAVTDPADPDAWAAALEYLDGNQTFYNVVGATEDVATQRLLAAYVASESADTVANYKAMVVGLRVPSVQMVIGQSSADDQAITPTSTDGDVVLATLSDNPSATGTQYTYISVPAGNAGFITHGVRAGDEVRYLFSIDGFGTPTYKTYLVDAVISEDSLRLVSGPAGGVSQPQRLEVWRTPTKDELVDLIIAQAGLYASKRVVAIWPDQLTSGGEVLSGYHAAAAFGGLRSAAAPHQPLTRAAIAGFDGVQRSDGYFSETQLRRLEQGGVTILQRDTVGQVMVRHAITTDTSDLKKSEESMRVNLDSVSLACRNIVSPLIGRANNWSGLGALIDYRLNEQLELLTRTGATAELGPQLNPDATGTLNRVTSNEIHPTLADKRLIVVRVNLPAPFNVADLTIIA